MSLAAAQTARPSTDPSAFAGEQFASALLAWFDRNGRKHLPWQQQITPYRVWISEIMLQQTQVATVIPYYERFMQRFPDVRALAAADDDEVLHLWTGLGYYARARNLLRAARLIVAEHGGEFPDDIEAVQALPGIGRSTAGAILAISKAQRHPILDGNVKRVLTRCFGIQGFPGETAIERKLWALADACTPAQRVAHYTQAIMDLGATVCVRSRPLCVVCPMHEPCIARRDGMQAILPTPKPRKARPERTAYAAILRRPDGAVLLERRPPTGLWGGLWTFPQFDAHEDALAWMEQRTGEASLPTQALPPYSHSFTHFDLTLQPILLHAAREQFAIAEGERYCWYDAKQPAKIGLAKPAVDLIRGLADHVA
ncbi:A/G-specific adenine glycosylase [Steroidobacter sp. S1-65]|uniref:Adenine DNA glycosylase n=1 Tax=Steroidobacter gossypii TaxID=2805490 RepID=A0ABS1WRZ9_9GAMM|nr:A/G-specific adenine glycosylase [Steroidobacter gossypii]